VESISLSVVIPVYNEAENIRPLVESLESALRAAPGQTEMLFVDDGSTDQTLALLKEAQEKDARIRIAATSVKPLPWRRGFAWREERRW